MITIQDCIDMSGLDEAEILALAEHEHISEIAAAAREQAEGIGQVNQGLGQIDQVTQQNTANAEESAAAAEELSSQAENLRQMLARFTLRQQQTARIHSKQSVSRHETVNHQIALGWGENS